MRGMTRRSFAWSGLAFSFVSTSAVAGQSAGHVRQAPASLYDMELGPAAGDESRLPPMESEVDFPVPPESADLPEALRAQTVSMPDVVAPGTIVVDAMYHFLYRVNDDGTARRFGVGVGREGFSWSGKALIGMKRRWPRWVPPREMVQRDAKARRWANGQPGGPGNPLGARALYLYQDGKDTLYRIHGTNQPDSIGKSVSSGCIRMLNAHIAELYELVRIGTPVLVLPVEEAPVVVQASG